MLLHLTSLKLFDNFQLQVLWNTKIVFIKDHKVDEGIGVFFPYVCNYEY